MLTDRQTRRLAEIEAEIAQVKTRLGRSHALGDSSASQGISMTYSDQRYWQSRLDRLLVQRDQLLDLQAGVTTMQQPAVNLSYYRPTQ